MTNNQLTKEWLQNRIADMESTRDDIPFGFDESGNNELAAFKLALAAMDSEPVAYMTYKGYLLHAGDPKLAEYSEPTPLYADPRPAAMPAAPVAWLWSRDGDDERDVSLTPPDDDDDAADAIECGWTATPLYRHAQHPVVPDDVLDALQKVARIRLDLNDFEGDRRGIADCLGDAEEALIEVVNRRAAMLVAAPQSPGSEPATVPGKWIPVSERMPDEGETVLGCCGLNGRHSGIYTMRASVIHRKNSAIDTYGIKHERVTHWMPLPAAPQEVK
ncbi:TPA: DUF551 domain-containing protein [Klebsiella michiganensis]|nr:DUF551 domain-containing protein [Klebsiella michiganensis]HDT6069295.1 DUF551 domain-containing protein [Klebsiella michiganensis]